MSRGQRRAMIRRGQPELSLSRQCEILAISRSSFYYTPKGESPENLALMRRLDELFLKYPFYGSRQMVRQLRRDGNPVRQIKSQSEDTSARHSREFWPATPRRWHNWYRR